MRKRLSSVVVCVGYAARIWFLWRIDLSDGCSVVDLLGWWLVEFRDPPALVNSCSSPLHDLAIAVPVTMPPSEVVLFQSRCLFSPSLVADVFFLLVANLTGWSCGW
ncbi:hypothetical protein ISN44_As06g041250 [Arabidopsis suecica]|uniref:Uncharacterized protein n=1 Tax=Arabidopsis suecica TaxID=45249 RepID=A0A8T2CQR5_ARASU|nr:hypothetical protein ISN44_As06g041250 [Arabidopsis suecica]